MLVYLCICVFISGLIVSSVVTPTINAMEPTNMYASNPKTTKTTFFIMFTVLAPIMLYIFIIPKSRNNFIRALSHEMGKEK